MLTIAQESTFHNPRRGWATLTSFAMQATLLAVALIIPLFQPSLMPRLDFVPRPVSISLSPAATQSAPHNSSKAPADPVSSVITVPPSIPLVTKFGPDPSAPPDPEPPCPQCVPGIGSGTPSIPGGIDVIGIPVAPLPPKPVVKPRISVMMDGYLIHRVQPDYPILAKQARVQGPVALAAVISRAGVIERLRVLSGSPMLIPPAISAVKQWRYRPYVLNGDPIEVDTEITVIFSLAEN